jgi:Pyruvate/2-oxoacid:ferredoxin oxidoreductase delta subunit
MDGGVLLNSIATNATGPTGFPSFIKDNLAILILLLTALGYIFLWFLNEWSKRSDRENRRKEERYKKLINGLSGYVEPGDTKLQNEFKNDLNLCWLYCPDDVINKAREFFIKAEIGTDDDRSNAAGELLLAIRKDALKRWPWWWDWLIEKFPWFKKTRLTPENYREKPLRIVRLSGISETRSRAGATTSGKRTKKHCWQLWK